MEKSLRFNSSLYPLPIHDQPYALFEIKTENCDYLLMTDAAPVYNAENISTLLKFIQDDSRIIYSFLKSLNMALAFK